MGKKILEEVNRYYTAKIQKYGLTPQGVDWNSTESQELRFSILSEVLNFDDNYSVLDFGCGFGSMYDFYLRKNIGDFTYTGFDISSQMILEAKKKYGESEKLNWLDDLGTEKHYDYVIASGIFNVKQDNSEESWTNYILETLNKINEISTKGFSFNVLTKYSDKEYMRDYLYYADPLILFDYCKKKFSKYVVLKHDYPLYEFTIIVRKDV